MPLTFLQVEYVSGEAEVYLLPLAFASGKRADVICATLQPVIVARLTLARGTQREGIIYDAIIDDAFHNALLDLVSSRRRVEGYQGALHGSHTAILRRMRMRGPLSDGTTSHTGQNHSTIVFGDKLILKLFRRLDVGINPELELGEFLTARKFPYSPPVAGALEYRGDSEPIALAVVNRFIPQARTAWDYSQDSLGRFYEQIQTLQSDAMMPPPLPSGSIAGVSVPKLPKSALELFGTYLDSVGKLEERTAALHLTLSSDPPDAGFAPEPLTPHAQRGLFQSMRNLTRTNLQLLENRMGSLAPEIQPQARQVLDWEPEILKRFQSIYLGPLNAMRIRHHGDFHLENVFYDSRDFWIVDFESEPSIALSERRLKHSALRDVAGMIRSFHYAANVALNQHLKQTSPPPERCQRLAAWARFWARCVSIAYYQSYCRAAGQAAFLPGSAADRQIMLDTYLLRKAFYELDVELNQRPSWVAIPLEGIIELMAPAAGDGGGLTI